MTYKKEVMIIGFLFLIMLGLPMMIATPSVIWNTQVPADLSPSSIFGPWLNITYNITSSPISLNLSRINIFYNTNSTTQSILTFINGSYAPLWGMDLYTSNVSSIFLWSMPDDEIYPATYNLDNDVTDSTLHTQQSMGNTNTFISMRFFNVSNSTNNNYFEIMSSWSQAQSIYYCNSSYNFASDAVPSPLTSPRCILAGTIPAGSPMNHTHPGAGNSSHQVVKINITSGKIGTIVVTPTSYFMLRGGASGGVKYYTVPNISRIDSMKLTTNTGASFANQTFTVDAHFHQFKGTDSFNYYVCANDTSNNENCSSIRRDLLNTSGLPPSPPVIYNPTSGYYTGNITINYTASVSPNQYNISYYNISLLNVDNSFNKTIQTNNLLNLSYIWNSIGVTTGNYTISVNAIDVLNQSSIGYSSSFVIYYPYPTISYGTGMAVNHANLSQSNVYINVSAESSIFNNITYNLFNSTWNNSTTYTTLTTSTQSINFTNISDGRYWYYVNITDLAGNQNSTSIYNITLDTHNPNVTLIFPENDSYNSTTTQNFTINITDNLGIKNGTFYLYNNTGVVNTTTTNFAVNIIQSTIGIVLTLTDTVYHWWYQVFDWAGNQFTTQNNTLTIDTIFPTINFTFPTETSGSQLNRRNININVSVNDTNIKNITIHLYNSSHSQTEINTSTSSPFYINYTSLLDGTYFFNATTYDLAGHYNYTETRNVTIDATPPTITVLEPLGQTYNFNEYISLGINVNDSFSDISFVEASILKPDTKMENVTMTLNPTYLPFFPVFGSYSSYIIVENTTVQPAQTCVATISTLGATTSLSGDGSPLTDTLCSLISNAPLFGDFEITIDYNLTNLTESSAINFQITSGQPTSANAIVYAYIGRTNFAGEGNQYQVYGADKITFGFLNKTDTTDTYGKMRIKRVNDIFTFYILNNTDSSWIMLANQTYGMNPGVYLLMESENINDAWGTADVNWTNLLINWTGTPGTYVGVFTNTTQAGTYTVKFFANDTFNNVNDYTYASFKINETNYPPSTPFITFPINTGKYNKNINITWSQVIDANNDSVVFNISLLNPDNSFNRTIVDNYGNLNTVLYTWNTSTVPDGDYTIEVEVKETLTSEKYSRSDIMTGNFTIDNTPPACTLINKTPTDINDSSTGLFNVLINCTDTNGINVTQIAGHYNAFATRTMDSFILSPGIPNYWSNRYPNNSLGVIGTLTPPYKIWRAEGRNRGFWYENLTGLNDCTGQYPCYQILNDTFSYAIEDGHYGYLTLTNTSLTSALFNFTYLVEPTVFRQSIYLSWDSMIAEQKKNHSITNDNYVLIKRFDAEAYRNTANYTMNYFRNIDGKGSPTAILKAYYCNSSYDPTGSVKVIDSPNCGFISSMTEANLNNIVLTEKNSSYSKGAYGITNGLFGGIKATAEFYIEYETLESNPGSSYELKYANGSTITNIGFNETNVAWTTTDGGITWTQAPWTPDVFTETVRSVNEEFQFGIYVEDNLGNIYKNFSFFIDDITPTNHPITIPSIIEYNSTIDLNDLNLNGTHRGLMNIKIGISSDPDAPGIVTHNLSLFNTDGTFNYTINGSFHSPDDSDMWINFDTKLVPNGKYRMNIQAIADDNPIDTKNRTTSQNFTINNPNATLLTPTNNSYHNTDQNFTVNITDTLGILNATLHIFNETGSEVNTTIFTSIAGSIQATIGIVVSLIDGIYNWFYEIWGNTNIYTPQNNISSSITTSNSILTNVTEEANFTHLTIIGDTSSPWRGFNYTTRTAFVPYFQDDDNSYSQFDGVDDFINISGTLNTTLGNSGALSFSVWVKRSGTISNAGILGIGSGGSPALRQLWVYDSGGATSNIVFQSGSVQATTATSVMTNDVWTHIAGSHNGTVITLYINGIPKTSVSSAIATGDSMNYIGFINGFGRWNGSIDNVLILNRSLNSTEVTSLYNLGRKDITYTDTSLVSSYRFDDTNASVAQDTIGTNNGTFVNGANYGYDALGLVAYYPFDVREDVNVNKTYDYSNNNKDGTLTQPPTFNTSLYGNCYSFDGADDYIATTKTIPNDDFSISFWAYKKGAYGGANTYKGIMSQNYNIVYEKASSNFGMYYNGVDHSSGVSLNTNVWDYYAIVKNSTVITFYRNGTKIISIAETGRVSDIGGLNIGRYYLGSTYFNGSLDEVMIFNTALNSSQISDIYNNQSIRFKSQGTQTIKQVNITSGYNQVNLTTSFNAFFGSNISARLGAWDISLGYNNSDLISPSGLVAYYHLDSNNGTINYTADSSGTNNGNCINMGSDCNFTSGVYYNSIGFDGVDDYISVPNNIIFNMTEFTLSTWFYWIGTSCNGECPLIDRCTGSSCAKGYRLRTGSNYASFSIGNGTEQSISGGNPTTIGWHYLVGTYNSSGWQNVYLDGSFKLSKNSPNIIMLDKTLDIGLRSGWNYYYNGSIDEVMIFNRSLSADEIKELYIKGRANFNYTSYQNLTGSNVFNISMSSTNLIQDFNFLVGNNQFFTSNLLTSNYKLFMNPTIQSSKYTTQNYTVTIDKTKPIINITYPLNITYNIFVGDLNYTIIEINKDSCWYSKNNGITNSTPQVSGTNWTGVISIQGSNTWIVYCNDSAGNINSSSVTFNIDTIFPQFTNNITSPPDFVEYSPGATYQFNITIINTNGTVGIDFNGINYSLSNISGSFYKDMIDLGAGTYSYYYWAYGNGTTNIFDISETYSYTINRNSSYGLAINGTTPITYGTMTDITGLNCPPQLTCVFDKPNDIYPVGIETFDYSTLGNANYTASAITKDINITKAASSASLLFGGLSSPKEYGTTITPTCTMITGETPAVLEMDGAIIISGVPLINLNVSTHFFNCTVPETQNYTHSQYTYNFVITKATPVLTFLANGGTNNLTLEYPQQINISARTSSTGVIGLDKDGMDYLSNNSLNVTLDLGSYIFRANITGDENYTDIGYSYYNITIIDTTPPNATLLTPANNSIYNTDQNFSVNLTDTHGLDNATLHIYNLTDDLVNQTLITSIYGSLQSTIGVVVVLTDGIYHWFYNVFDIVGNQFITGNYTVTIDRIPPILTIDYPTNGGFYKVPVTNLNVSLNKPLGNCSVNSTFWIYNSHNSTQYSFINSTEAVDSIAMYNITCSDLAGNNASIILSYTQDTHPPVILMVNGSYSTSQNPPEIFFNATDNLDTALSCQLYLNTTPYGSNIVPSGVISSIVANASVPDGINYTINITCYDNVNNIGFNDSTWIFINGVYPQFSNNRTHPLNNSQFTNINQFNITINDTNGTAGIEINGMNYSLSNISNSFYVDITGLGIGTYSYYYWAHGSGLSGLFNVSETYSYTIIQNTTLVLGLTATTPIDYNTTTNFAGSGCPPQLTCTLNITNGIFAAGNISANYSTPGNVNYSATSTTFTVTINKIPAPLTLTSSAGWTLMSPPFSSITGGCLASLTCNLYLAGVGVTNPYTNLFPPGAYPFTFETLGNVNYSATNISNTLISKSSVVIIITCRYVQFEYYNTALPWLHERNCV